MSVVGLSPLSLGKPKANFLRSDSCVGMSGAGVICLHVDHVKGLRIGLPGQVPRRNCAC